MATNERLRDADHLSLPVPAGTKAGDPVRVGILNGVAVTDRARTDVPPRNQDSTVNADYNYGGGNPNGYATVWLKGSHEFTTGIEITSIGQAVYITAANALSASASGNSLYGAALNLKGATSGPLTVRLGAN